MNVTEKSSRVSKRKPSQSDIDNAVDIIDLIPTLKTLVADAKAKAKENEIYFTSDMRLTVYFCRSAILRVLNRNPRQLDDNDKDLIAYLKRVGCNANEIAYAVNRSKGAVISHLKEHVNSNPV